MKRKIYLSNNKKLAGVCGGIAEYFDLDPTIIRLAWVLLALLNGVGIIAYIVAAIVIPKGEGYYQEAHGSYGEDSFDGSNNTGWVLGLLLIIIGGVFALKNFFPELPLYWHHFRRILSYLWPFALIGLGLKIIIAGRGQ